jgi:polygalacturonase
MHWNYRLVNCPSTNGGDDWIEFKEVFYSEQGGLLGYGNACIGSETKADLQDIVARLNKALDLPVLHESNF